MTDTQPRTAADAATDAINDHADIRLPDGRLVIDRARAILVVRAAIEAQAAAPAPLSVDTLERALVSIHNGPAPWPGAMTSRFFARLLMFHLAALSEPHDGFRVGPTLLDVDRLARAMRLLLLADMNVPRVEHAALVAREYAALSEKEPA